MEGVTEPVVRLVLVRLVARRFVIRKREGAPLYSSSSSSSGVSHCSRAEFRVIPVVPVRTSAAACCRQKSEYPRASPPPMSFSSAT